MRRIIKGPEPDEMRLWKQENASVPQNLIYSNMPKAGAKLQMLTEQGYLCAYTMERIWTLNHCHVEHIVPQTQPNQPVYFDIDYNNLLACMPSDTPGYRPNVRNFPYGARRKAAAQVDDDTFVSPLQADVEVRFHYVANGFVEASADDNAARNTIQVLALNHGQLVDLRKAAIEERILELDPALSAEDAATLAQEIMVPDQNGKLPEFCLAISQVAAEYSQRIRENS